MSSDSPRTGGSESRSPPRRKPLLTPSTKVLLLMWLVMAVVAWFVHSWDQAGNDAVRRDLAATQDTILGLRSEIQSGSPQLKQELEQLRGASQTLIQRLDVIESAVGNDHGKVRITDERASEQESVRAVARAKAALLAAQARISRERLAALKKLQATWTALDVSLLTGDLGRHIAGSPQHLELVLDVLNRERPSTEQLVVWETQLDDLAGTADATVSREDSIISITEEHTQMLKDLSQTLTKSLADFEQQVLLLSVITRETASLPLHTATLGDVLRERRETSVTNEAQRLVTIRQTAHKEALRKQEETITRLAREAVEAGTKRVDEQIAEEERVRKAGHRAKTAGLQAEAKRVDDVVRRAQLERELSRDMADVRGYLTAFTTEGFKHRLDGTKGPISFAWLEGEGALEATRPGMERLMWLATENDRPRGGIPFYIGSDSGWDRTEKAPIERAQELLRKYGKLLVEKGLLAP